MTKEPSVLERAARALPIWPPEEMIIRSLNNRSNLYARPADDPLFGIPITPEMIARVQAYQAATPYRMKESGSE